MRIADNFIEQSDFDEKKIDAYVNRSLAVQSVGIINADVVLILIINLVRTVFKYFDYKITRQNGSLLLSLVYCYQKAPF
jgi:putative membrane protein